tara:strand:- start:7 stop:447 length:441 start_codon:yes stop_codon:yes gene_type:complete
MAVPSPTARIDTQVDLRLDIDGSTFSLNGISGESVTLASTTSAAGTSFKIGFLAERPATANFASSNAAPSITSPGSINTLVTTIAGVDAATKFYIDYERGFVIVANSISGPLTMSYSGMGTVVRSKELNDCISEIGQATVMALALG